MKLHEFELNAIRQKVDAFGINKTAAQLAIARGTLLQILANQEIRHGTAMLVRSALFDACEAQ